jgi:glycosyltransferase involved in cell wall biosynthesis
VSALAVLDALSAVLLAAMLLVALANLACAPRLHRAGVPRVLRRVSVLVPARNEAANLRAHLPLLLASRYPRLEVLVLDDGSEDGTAAVAEAFAREAPGRLRLIHGAPLPAGWLGKPWACAQLARAARGDVLIFCDADVAVGPRAAARTVALLERHAADAATAIPRPRLEGAAEAAAVPLVAQFPVAAMLPLALVPRTASPRVSMANGQWLAFTRDAYARVGGHAAVRGAVLEDVLLGRAVKRAGLRLVAAAAPHDLAVRMYDGWNEARAGFRKNLYALLGGRPATFAAGACLFLLSSVYPFLAAARGTAAGVLALALLAAVRIASAALFRQGWRTVLLHPLGAVLALRIAVESFATRGRVQWRGRWVGGEGGLADRWGGDGLETRRWNGTKSAFAAPSRTAIRGDVRIRRFGPGVCAPSVSS